MPDTGPPYHLRFPDGDMPPDGPTQIGELASDVAGVIRNVENKVDSHLQDTTNFRASNYQWNTNQDNAIAALQARLGTGGGAATQNDIAALEKRLSMQTPIDLHKEVRVWGNNISGGMWKKWEFTNIKRKYQGNSYPISNIGAVTVGWSVRNDLLVEEFEAYVDGITPTSFTVKVKAKKNVSGYDGQKIGSLVMMVFPDTAAGAATDADRGQT